MHLMPRTRLGKWCVGLMVLSLLFFVLLTLFAVSGQKGGETFTDNLLLAVPGFAAMICAVGAFVAGITDIIRTRERSPLVILCTAIGLAVTLFVIGEFAFPH